MRLLDDRLPATSYSMGNLEVSNKISLLPGGGIGPKRTFECDVPCKWDDKLVDKAGAPVSPTLRLEPRPLDFLRLRAVALASS